MNLYESTREEALELSEPMDYRAKRFFGFYYKPPVWEATKEYIDGMYVVPSTGNGHYYGVDECGVSGATEPVDWSLVDGTVTWKEYCYKMLPDGVTITDSSWIASDASVVLIGNSFDSVSTLIFVDSIPSGLEQIILTNITTRSNGEVEYRSMLIPIRPT